MPAAQCLFLDGLGGGLVEQVVEHFGKRRALAVTAGEVQSAGA